MSVRVMGLVFEMDLPPSEKVTALALADHAHDDGTEARPGNASLAMKTSLSERQVQRVVKSLVAKGVLAIQRPATNTKPVVYCFPTAARGDKMSPQEVRRGDTEGALGVTSRASGGDIRVTQTVIEPSDEPSLSLVEEPPTRIDELCDLLATLIEGNGSRRPTVTARWRTDMRLLHERDGRSFAQIENMIRWCQADDFWRANILSPNKLRAKYDQMRLRASASRKSSPADRESQIDQAVACILSAFNVPRETVKLPLDDPLAERVRQRVSLREMGKMAPDQIRHLVAATAYDQKERHA